MLKKRPLTGGHNAMGGERSSRIEGLPLPAAIPRSVFSTKRKSSLTRAGAEGSRGDLWRDPLARKISEQTNAPKGRNFYRRRSRPIYLPAFIETQGARCERLWSPQVASCREAERRLAGLESGGRAVAGVVAAAVPRAAALRADEQQRGGAGFSGVLRAVISGCFRVSPRYFPPEMPSVCTERLRRDSRADLARRTVHNLSQPRLLLGRHVMNERTNVLVLRPVRALTIRLAQ